MVIFKTFNDIVLDMLQNLQLTQPNLDVKPNSVARDLFVDNLALRIADVYTALRQVSALQSITNLNGQDLTNYGMNFGLERRIGTKSSGSVLLTFRSLSEDISILAGSVVRTRQNIPFTTISSTTAFATQANSLRATATRFRNQLNTAGITDEFALEVSVEAQSTGSAGNVSAYSIISHNIPSVNSITNIFPFSGGTDLEDDSTYRSRILAIFSGTNVGTALGYRSAVLNLPNVIDALVIESGDPLMTRDGTITSIDEDGNITITQSGTGGKVDIYVMGTDLQTGIDSFVYNDQSGTGQPTDLENDYVLGQSDLTSSTNLSLNTRRVNTLSGTDQIPLQPINNITAISGSSSGPNFTEYFVDEFGIGHGNYMLVKDVSQTGGSPFGLDKLRWMDNEISLSNENKTKGIFNGVDGLGFTDVNNINGVRQDIQVVNENSNISKDRKYITTKHSPVRNVSRVFNLTTGERYFIVNQNPDGSGSINSTGKVEISGKTLPNISDILQVDYTWIKEFDKNVDFYSLNLPNLGNIQDSIDWGFSNYIIDERADVELDDYNNLTLNTKYPISRLISVNSFIEENSEISGGSSKTIELSQVISNIYSVKDIDISGEPEIYNTQNADGNFSNVIVSLPTDTIGESGNSVKVLYNLENILDIEGYNTGLILNNQITLNPYTILADGTEVSVNYVANLGNIIPQTNISQLPISTDGFNSFVGIDGYQPVLNEFSGNNVVKNERFAPTQLRVTMVGIPIQGIIKIVGTTFNKYEGVFTTTRDDTLDLSALIREAESLKSNENIPTNIHLARVSNLEKVEIDSRENILSTIFEYDLTNYKIKSNTWDKNSIVDSSLNQTEFSIQDISTNDSPITTGSALKVAFYYYKTNDYENLFFSRSGTLITSKIFGHISSINKLSGFQDTNGTVSGRFTIDSFNQPQENTSYFVDYTYVAPKENERITINYEYNQIITDATQAIENSRPITADVLVKSAVAVTIDVQAKIVVSEGFKTRAGIVKQDVMDNITSTLNASSLGTTLDASDLVNSAYNVDGLDRITIIKFNKENTTGTKLSISANKNEYLTAGMISVEVENR